MIKKDLDTWEQFEGEVNSLTSKIKEIRGNSKSYQSPILFRGQRDSEWPLETTLDRIKKNLSQKQYYIIMKSVQSSVESCTEKRWNLPSPDKYEEKDCHAPLGYDFMVYLRHNGFPSPLLDWTRSYHIASFFAFNENSIAKRISICAYVEYLIDGKSWCGEKITGLGPHVTTHKRHFLQQSEYTICTVKKDGLLIYKPHKNVVVKNKTKNQDLLKQYTLPSSERTKVLRKLDSININSYSLFENEEGLMDTLSKRNFLLNKYL
ncbi:MAG: FRG domain-containing protein [Candidatus Omnitrophota bacterium]|jgi:hypothetical protein